MCIRDRLSNEDSITNLVSLLSLLLELLLVNVIGQLARHVDFHAFLLCLRVLRQLQAALFCDK